MGKWLKNLGQGKSSVSKLNCLYQHENVFVMDNHKAAIWSWFQNIDLNSKYNYLHIDRHYDLLDSQLADWVAEIKNLKKGKIEDYTLMEFDDLKYQANSLTMDVFRFDNFFPIACELHPKLFKNLVFVTHKEGTIPENYKLIQPSIFHLGENLSFWINDLSNDDKWIIDLDIDFFFSDNETHKRDYFLNIEFAENLANQIYENRELIEVFTIALSPTWSKSWDDAIEFANVFCEKFGFKINI